MRSEATETTSDVCGCRGGGGRGVAACARGAEACTHKHGSVCEGARQ
jgi:hypothetical protein